jgi:hypothetical protein
VNNKFPNRPYDSLNTGIADGLKDMANIKASGQKIPPDYAMSIARGVAGVVHKVHEMSDLNNSFFDNAPNMKQYYDKVLNDGGFTDFYNNINKDIKTADAPALAQEPAAGGQGRKYDLTKSVGLEGAAYREMLKTAAPVIDHLLANANVDQTQAQNAAAFERAALINGALESSRKMPDLIVRSVAFEARTLSPEGLETMRGELQKLVKIGDPNADEVNGAIESVIEAAKKGITPNSPGFEKASAPLKRYVSAALRSAETGSPGTASTDAGRKSGAQKNRQ